MSESKLTTDENKVLDLLTDAWNEYQKLPMQHLIDSHSFMTNLHHLQHLIMIRPTRRANPEILLNLENQK